MRQCCKVGSESTERLHVGSHDIGNTADLRIMPKIVHGAAPLPPALSKSFQCHVEADFVSILEAVGHGFSWIVDLDRDSLNEMLFDPGAEGISRETHDVQWEALCFGFSCLDIDGHPDFERSLSGQSVETQSREQTNHSVGDSLADLRKAMVFAHISIRQGVEASSHPLYHTLAV